MEELINMSDCAFCHNIYIKWFAKDASECDYKLERDNLSGSQFQTFGNNERFPFF